MKSVNKAVVKFLCNAVSGHFETFAHVADEANPDEMSVLLDQATALNSALQSYTRIIENRRSTAMEVSTIVPRAHLSLPATEFASSDEEAIISKASIDGKADGVADGAGYNVASSAVVTSSSKSDGGELLLFVSRLQSLCRM